MIFFDDAPGHDRMEEFGAMSVGFYVPHYAVRDCKKIKRISVVWQLFGSWWRWWFLGLVLKSARGLYVRGMWECRGVGSCFHLLDIVHEIHDGVCVYNSLLVQGICSFSGQLAEVLVTDWLQGVGVGGHCGILCVLW
jgi:hypothetical protein